MPVQRQPKQRKKSIGSQDKNNKMSGPPVMHEPGRQSVHLCMPSWRALIGLQKRNKEIETRGKEKHTAHVQAVLWTSFFVLGGLALSA